MAPLVTSTKPRVGPSENGLITTPPALNSLRNLYTKKSVFSFTFLRSCLSPFASNFTRLTNFLHKSRSSTAGTPPNSDKPSRAPSHQRLTRETSASSSPSPPEPRSASAPITASPAPFPRLSTKYSSSYSSSTPSSGYSSASPPEAEAGGKFMEARMR